MQRENWNAALGVFERRDQEPVGERDNLRALRRAVRLVAGCNLFWHKELPCHVREYRPCPRSSSRQGFCVSGFTLRLEPIADRYAPQRLKLWVSRRVDPLDLVRRRS